MSDQRRLEATLLGDAERSRTWQATEGREGAPVQWIGESLDGLDLRNAVLVDATLLGSSFRGAQLDASDVSRAFAGGAVFDRCTGRGCRFVKAELTDATFDAADLGGASFLKATLQGCSFRAATLDAVQLDGADCSLASFSGASMRDASLKHTDLSGADLSASNLAGAHFADTRVDAATRLDSSTGLRDARVDSILVGADRLEGGAALAWMIALAARPRWTVSDLELWLLAKMSGARVADALGGLGASTDTMNSVAGELSTVFDQPVHSAAEYRRILGKPIHTRLSNAPGSFAGSRRHEYVLPLWPDVTFVVNEDTSGMAWGVGFEGGIAPVPDDLRDLQPWHWTAERLRREAVATVVEEELTFNLEAILTFAPGTGPRRFCARFEAGLLQSWRPTDAD